MVLFGQKWLFSEKVVNLGQTGCIRVKLLFSGKVVVFGLKGCVQAKMVVF